MRAQKKRTVGILLLMVTTVAVPVISGIGYQYQGNSISEATRVQEGKMTEKQREHSKLYNGLGTGKKLRDLALEIPGGVKVKRNTPIPAGESDSPVSFTEFLGGLTCNADAVIIGIVKDKSSQITEDGEFVFTDYALKVEEVLKDNALAHLIPDVSLTLTQPGGKVELSGHIVEAEDASYQPLAIGGRYALFLKFIPATGAYASFNSTSSYELRDDKITVQTKEPVSSQFKKETASTLVENIRNANARPCAPKGTKNE